MKKWIIRALRWLGMALAVLILLILLKAQVWGRWYFGEPQSRLARVELNWEDAAADGTISPEEIAVHYAPEIHAAVNVLLSDSGRGDFLAAADFDGDWKAINNWEHMTEYPLLATVYYSVQETDTHYFVGYYFYHPRDDAEIWLDRHENDFEGIMLAIPKEEGRFAAPIAMYTQGHGHVPFYFDADWTMTAGSRRGGGLLLDGDRPVVYIAPNGTLSNAGHSVESAAEHTTYWAVGRSGIRYYHGGEAQEPVTFKGDFRDNPCSYALVSLDVLWDKRSGPYGDSGLFAHYSAFRGENWGENSANPAWAWRNKTIYGFGGSFLSDPAWTFNRAVEGIHLSWDYRQNPYADWLVTVEQVTLPQGSEEFTLRLQCDGWVLSDPAWWIFTAQEDGSYAVDIAEEGRTSLWAAAWSGAQWKLEVIDSQGRIIPGAKVIWEAHRITE